MRWRSAIETLQVKDNGLRMNNRIVIFVAITFIGQYFVDRASIYAVIPIVLLLDVFCMDYLLLAIL